MNTLTPFWGIEKTYVRYDPAKIPDKPSRIGSSEHVAQDLYENKVPRDGGKGITIYILEPSFTPSEQALIDVLPDHLRYLKGHEYPAIKTDEPYGIHGNLVVNMAGGVKFGAAPMAAIVPVNVVENNVDKAYSDILADVLERKLQGRAILNVSKGSDGLNMQEHLKTYETITKLLENGVVIVAAAGNDDLEVHRQDRNNMPQYLQDYKTRLQAFEEKKKTIDAKRKTADRTTITRKQIADEAASLEIKEAQKPIDEVVSAIKATNLRLPAAHPGVIAVGGCDERDGCEQFAHGTGVDIYAPSHRIPYLGTDGKIFDTRPPSTKGSTTVDGTSYAAPFTAGTIASMMTEHYKHQQKFEPWKQQDIIETLYKRARWTSEPKEPRKLKRYILCYHDDKMGADVQESDKNWQEVKDSCSKPKPLYPAARPEPQPVGPAGGSSIPRKKMF